MATQEKILFDLVIGDIVLVDWGNRTSIGTVTRLTKAHILIGEYSRFSKKTGYAINRNSRSPYIRFPRPGELERKANHKKWSHTASRLARVDWYKYQLPFLDKVEAILAEEKENR